jgi:hypothetical protein
MSFTYAELKQAIQDYAENDETSFVTNLPIFVRAAEERIFKNVQLSFFRKNATANVTASNEYLAVPNDFLAPFSLSFTNSDGDKEFLLFKDVNFIQDYNTDASDTGSPRYYAQFDLNNFIIGPTPDDSYVVELHYYYRPVSLTNAGESGTTWLSENAPMAMLYGSLIDAYTYMKGEPDLIANYSQRFTEAVASLKQLGEAKETTDQYRYGQVLRPKQ